MKTSGGQADANGENSPGKLRKGSDSMHQNTALLLYLATAISAECIPVMLLLLTAGLTVNLIAIKKRPAERELQQSAQGKLTYLYSTASAQKSQGGSSCEKHTYRSKQLSV